MDKENFFNFPPHFPYSTDSESDDEDVAELTRRFSRSASLQEPLYNLKEKRGLPESALGWSGSVPSQAYSPPAFVKGDEDAWHLIYAAAGQVARMKMRMNRGILGAPCAFARPPWGKSDGEEFFQFYRNRGGSDGGGCGGWPPCFPQSAWPPPQNRPNQHKPCNGPVMKPAVLRGSGGGCDIGGGGATPAKRECPGTGVFLPRRYCNNPPESRKKQASSPANIPARMIQSSTKTFGPITPSAQIQARVNGGFNPNYGNAEMLMGRRNGMIVAAQQQRRSNIMETAVNNPEVLLPQEWTY